MVRGDTGAVLKLRQIGMQCQLGGTPRKCLGDAIERATLTLFMRSTASIRRSVETRTERNVIGQLLTIPPLGKRCAGLTGICLAPAGDVR